MDTGKLIDSMKRVVKSELGSYDTTATVKRVEGDTAWVHIPGGVDETPVRLTMNAKEGDNVQVRVSDGKAFLAGNVSAPPTDDTTAEAAKALANRAAEDAGRAKSAADIAESYATSAQASAAQSANILEGMEQAAIAAGTTLDGIYADAAEAKATTDEINTYADTAGKTVTQILEDGETAGVAAQAASEAANSALVGLSTVEDVVGVLNWITEHGTMTLTSDVTVNPAHVYFIVDPAGDYVVGGTHYSIVSEPDDADIGTYYELSIDESVENYVATHIVVDSEGLWIIPDAGGNKVLIATGSGSTYTTAGTYIVGTGNVTLASFTASGAQIGENASGKSRTEIGTAGMQIIQNVSGTDTQISNLGYGPGTNSVGGTSNAPYYTLGIRTGTVGNYSTAEGYNAEASGYMSHAEGDSTASGYCSHAEGNSTYATGKNSHAQNYGTYAQRRSQTAIGEFNELDTSGADETAKGDYIFIVGNGTGDNTRNNAFTVDWSGNTNVDGDLEVAQFLNVTRTITSSASISATGNITAGGNVEAAGDVTDGAGTSIADLLEVQNTYGVLTDLTGNTTLTASAKKLPLKTFSGNGCSLSSNGIKVTNAGTYLVSGTAYFHSGFTANDIVHLQLYKNSTLLEDFGVRMALASPYENVTLSPYIVTLSANDVMYLYAYNQTGARGSVNTGATRNFLMLNRIA